MAFFTQAKCVYCTVKGKSKAQVKVEGSPITFHEGTEGEYRYVSMLSLISALDGDVWLTPRPNCFTPGNKLVPILQEAGWAGPLRMGV